MDKIKEENAYLRMLLKFFHIKATGGDDLEFAKLVDTPMTDKIFNEVRKDIEKIYSDVK